MTRTTIRAVFNKAETAYRFCWRVLVSMRGHSDAPNFFSDLLDYQTTLATAIFDLDRLYKELEKERNQVVRTKASLTEHRFLARVKRLGRYQEAVQSAIDLGKALGDAFAWFFYHNEHETLTKHREHEPITELPTGIGAAGELEFIRNMRHMNGHLILYHGITNILRHGDISLIDLEDFKLAGIAELKSHRKAPGELHVTMHCVTRNPASEVFGIRPTDEGPSDSQPMPPDMERRLRRQLHGMGTSLTSKPKDKELRLEADSYLPELERIGLALEGSQEAYERCGESLLLAGYRLDDSGGLFERLARRSTDMTGRVQGIREYVPHMWETGQRGTADDCNRLLIGGLCTEFSVDGAPLFWWPIRTDLAERIYFQNVGITTIYNPAHIVKKLRELGFQVHRIGKSRWHRVTKRFAAARLVLRELEYYTHLVQDQLWSEELIIQLVSHVSDLVEAGTVGENTAINMDLRQLLWRAPIDCVQPSRTRSDVKS